MSSRFSVRRLLKPLAYGTGLAVAGTAGMYIVYRPRNVPGAESFAPKPPKRDDSGNIIPPKFPYIKTRAEQITDLKKSSSAPSSEIYDLLVIGGGATGTGIAVDAATRGLKVAIVERDDFSSGTSSKSTKLVHGGVRYLEKAVWNLDWNQYQLVKEALRERKSFLYTAPHLSSWLPIMLPLQAWWQAPYFWAGTKFYDLLAGSEGIESSYFLPRSKALEAFPMLRKDNLIGALVYYDGQHNDSRMNISLAMTGTLYGVTTVNHLEVTGLEKDASGQLTGAQVKDLIAEKDGAATNEVFTIKAKGIINATGPFSDGIRHMDSPSDKEIVSPSLGVHVVLPGYLSPQKMGLIDPSTSDGRVIFFLPWQGNTIAGTTDAPCAISQNPVAGEKDIQWILDEIRTYLSPEINVQRSDILAAWSGIRPLVRDPNSKNTESLVRSHLTTISDSGLLTCAGGKWTTYRQMAEEAVDKAIEVFKLQTQPTSYVPDIAGLNGVDPSVRLLDGTCQTHHIRLVGAHGYSTTLFINLIQHFGLDMDVAKHLATDYGDRAWDVAALAAPTDNTEHYPLRGQRLSSLFPFIDGEVRYAVRSEYAQTAADVLARRTRLSFLNAQAALHALPNVIDIMAEELKWSQQRKEVEWKDTVTFLMSMGLPSDLLEITREQVLRGEMASSSLAPARGASKEVVPLRPTLEPVSQAEGALP